MITVTDSFLFQGLDSMSRDSIQKILPDALLFTKGQTIYDKDHFQAAIGFIVEGKAVAKEDKAIKRTFSAGDCFGAAAMFGSDDHYVASIFASSDCKVVFLTEDFLKNLFNTHPTTAINYITFLSGRVRFLNRKLNLYTCKDATARLYRFLLDNSDENHTVIIKNMSQLAKLTSLGRSSLYRAIDELTESHVIERTGDTIKLVGDLL